MRYIRNVGMALDKLINAALFFGSSDETVSLNAAKAQKKGKRWACVLCRWFNMTIESHHCERVLAGENTKDIASVKALLQLIFVVVILWMSL